MQRQEPLFRIQGQALRQPVVPLAKRCRHSSGRAEADNRPKFAGCGDVDAREREPFRHPVLHDRAFGPQCRKKHMGKTQEDGVGNGQAACNALQKKYNGNTKEARRAYHEYLHNTKMESGDDPDDFLYTMDGYRERLDDLGQPLPDERYGDIILQAFPTKFERVRTASYERGDFHLADIRGMTSALYIVCLSHPNNSPSVVGCGVAMHLTAGGDSPINCHYCGNPGQRQKTCMRRVYSGPT